MRRYVAFLGLAVAAGGLLPACGDDTNPGTTSAGVGGGGGAGGEASTTGSMTTGSMTTGSMTTGSMTTGSMTTGSMTTTGTGGTGGEGTGGAGGNGTGGAGTGGSTSTGMMRGADGSPCTADDDCAGGLCFTEAVDGFPGGYCSGECVGGGDPCLGGGFCVDQGGGGVCAAACDATPDCRDAYSCEDIGVRSSICFPACDSDDDCTAPNTCDVTQGFCVAPESICNDLGDNDGDGLVDCQDPDCQAGGACTGGMTPTGDACTAANNCVATGDDPVCIDETGFGWAGGACSEFCSVMANDCTTPNSTCVPVSQDNPDLGVCLPSCTLDADCRGGYTCEDFGGATLVCAGGACTLDAQCTTTTHCDVPSGFCTFPEICGDGLDNEPDGSFDCEDDECAASCATELTTACATPTAVTTTIDGDTTTGTNLFHSQCGGNAQGEFAGANARELIYTYTPGAAGQNGIVHITLSSATDQGISVRTNCTDPASEEACADFVLGGTDETIDINAAGGVPLTIIVDAFTAAEEGPFTLTVSFEQQICGDGQVTAPEECDDGGVVPGDGCSPLCTVEADFFCAAAVPLVIGPNVGDTTTGSNAFAASCTGGGDAKEKIYSFTPMMAGELALTLASATDQGLYVRTTCADEAAEVSCVDNVVGGTDEELAIDVAAGVPLFIFVDGFFDAAENGPYTLTAEFTPAP